MQIKKMIAGAVLSAAVSTGLYAAEPKVYDMAYDEFTYIDVLFYYSNQWNLDKSKTLVKRYLEDGNQALANSLLGQFKYRLAGMIEKPYYNDTTGDIVYDMATNAGNWAGTSSDLTNYGADVGVYLRYSTPAGDNLCGGTISGFVGILGNYPYMVLNYMNGGGCTRISTFPHEMGHLLGGQHSKADLDKHNSEGFVSYNDAGIAYSGTNSIGSFGTVLTSGIRNRSLVYSSPKLNCDGQGLDDAHDHDSTFKRNIPCGDADHDMVSLIEETAPIIANVNPATGTYEDIGGVIYYSETDIPLYLGWLYSMEYSSPDAPIVQDLWFVFRGDDYTPPVVTTPEETPDDTTDNGSSSGSSSSGSSSSGSSSSGSSSSGSSSGSVVNGSSGSSSSGSTSSGSSGSSNTGSSNSGSTNNTGYQWITGNWSACSGDCTNPVQTRTVQCYDYDNALVKSDSFCSGTKPTTTQTCSAASSCSVNTGNNSPVNQSCVSGQYWDTYFNQCMVYSSNTGNTISGSSNATVTTSVNTSNEAEEDNMVAEQARSLLFSSTGSMNNAAVYYSQYCGGNESRLTLALNQYEKVMNNIETLNGLSGFTGIVRDVNEYYTAYIPRETDDQVAAFIGMYTSVRYNIKSYLGMAIQQYINSQIEGNSAITEVQDSSYYTHYLNSVQTYIDLCDKYGNL